MPLKKILIVALAACLGLMATSAEAAIQYGFTCITNKKASNASVGVNQLKVELFDVGWGNQVRFEFSNTGPSAGSATDIYFHDSSNMLTGLSWIQNQTGVNYVAGANPSTLSGGNAAGFVTDTALNTQSTSTSYGVNAGEKVGLTLYIAAGRTFGELVDAITAGTVRMGVYMMGFSSTGTESFVNNPTNIAPIPVTPEPSSLALGGVACMGLLWRRRQRAKTITSSNVTLPEALG